MEYHPAANLFPLIEGPEFDGLVEDIRDNGQRETIKLLDGLILDGRNRYRACANLGIDPRTETLSADTDPLRYVISLNLKRRHLNESQRAMVAAKVANLPPWRPPDKVPQLEHLSQPSISQVDAAKLLNVSRGSVQRAVRVATHCSPEVQRLVEGGEVRLAMAEKLAPLPKEEQEEAAKAGVKGVAAAARKASGKKEAGRKSKGQGGGRRTKKSNRHAGTHHATETEACDAAAALDDFLAHWESMGGFKKLVSTWESEKRWAFCDKLATLSRHLRRLSDELRHHGS